MISTDLGWAGTALILLAYLLLSFNILQANTIPYQLLNLFGAVGIFVDTYYKKDTPPELLNIIWALIAIVSMVRIILAH